jgi:hypothetical protein
MEAHVPLSKCRTPSADLMMVAALGSAALRKRENFYRGGHLTQITFVPSSIRKAAGDMFANRQV